MLSVISQHMLQLFRNPTPVLKELKDMENCGKRYIREKKDPKTAECFWNCEVDI